MQVVDYIDHHRFKITIFKAGSKYILKFDDGEHDFSIKFRDGEVDNIQEVKSYANSEILLLVDAAFREMYAKRKAGYHSKLDHSKESIL